MKTGITSILLAITLILTPSLPALASDTGTITITMTGVETIIDIALDKTNWALGNVTEDTEYKTNPEATWCTITNTGNVVVNLGINGAHAQFGTSAVYWFLSEDETNYSTDADPHEPKYALWYHIASDTEGSYTPITCHKTPTPMQKTDGTKITLEYGAPDESGVSKQFGLKLLTPASFPETYIDKEMTTHITISVVTPP